MPFLPPNQQRQSTEGTHAAYNNNNNRAITAAGFPLTKEPVGFARLDGKRPDGLTLIPWQGGKPLTWDVMVVSTLADSYLHSTSHSAGSTAETASVRKETKYSSLPPDFIFQLVAIETLGPLSACALSEVGRRLTSLSEDSHETLFLFQCLSMLIQRFNSALIMDSFCFSDEDLDL